MSRRILATIFLVSACSRSSPNQTGRQDLLTQAFIYGLDSLAVGENVAARRCLGIADDGAPFDPPAVCKDPPVRLCLGIDADTGTVDPPGEVLAMFRERISRVLTLSLRNGMLADLSALHDTMLISINFDSISTTTPTLEIRTWRSGLWGSGHRCSVRKVRDAWEIFQCQLEWVS